MPHAFLKAIIVFLKTFKQTLLLGQSRALKRLIDYKNAAAMAISILNNDLEEECDGNMIAEHYDK
jgi:hypothetical protein